VVKVPKAEENEAASLKLVLSLSQHFPPLNSDLGLNSMRALDSWDVGRESEVMTPISSLNSRFTHGIKPDKKGKNPA